MALTMCIGLVAAACSDDDDDSGVQAGGATTASGAAADTTAPGGATAAGGELVDVGTFTGKPPLHIDPALNTTLDAYQVINSVYDGLTELDTETDPANPVLKGLVAARASRANADATIWTFKIKSGLTFSDGEPIHPDVLLFPGLGAGERPQLRGAVRLPHQLRQGGQGKLPGPPRSRTSVTPWGPMTRP